MRRLLAVVLLAAPLLAAPTALQAQGWREWLGRMRLDSLGDRLGALQRPVTVWGELAVLEHRVMLDREAEQATGPVLGLAAQSAVTPWLDLRLAVRGGTLDANWAPSEDRRMGEISLTAETFPLPWIGVVGAASTRGYRTEFGRQRWTRLTIGPEVRTPLLGERVAGRVRIAAAPFVSVSETRAPSRALEGAATVTWESGRLRGALSYVLERYDFDAVQGARRLEQLSGLTVGLGWRLGR
jgi:hypothetical protein